MGGPDRFAQTNVSLAYHARDVLRRRRLVRAALGAKPAERILDVGCGPGFYLAELLG
jgi:arsenite methyltransferase